MSDKAAGQKTRSPEGCGRLAVFPRCSLLTYQSRYARRPARIPTRNTSCNDVGGATRSVAGGSRLEKQPTDLRRKPCYFADRTLGLRACPLLLHQQIFPCFNSTLVLDFEQRPREGRRPM